MQFTRRVRVAVVENDDHNNMLTRDMVDMKKSGPKGNFKAG